VRNLSSTGVTGVCPTLITGSSEQITRCLENITQAVEQFPEVARTSIGIHLEGPFISPEDGPRGAHPREHARPPDWNEFARWQETANGSIRIITLAPEWPGACSFIERAAGEGLLVAIGHTAADSRQIADAVSAGARMSTHLGNGSHAKLDRHKNYVWAQLAEDRLAASFIVDGHHLPPDVVKCMIRCKSPARSILVTDAIAATGLPPGRHLLGDAEVEVSADRRVSLLGTPYLAGSVLEMHDAVAKTVQYAGVTLDEALAMASANPARALGLEAEYGTIETGRVANLALFRWNADESSIEIVATIIGGEVVYMECGGSTPLSTA
jgi:N-acetylglucosamine-6-phosphate deacetylase